MKIKICIKHNDIVIKETSLDSGSVTLESLYQIIHKALPVKIALSTLLYEDEDGDSVTIRNAEDIESMIDYYRDYAEDCLSNHQQLPPLIIKTSPNITNFKQKSPLHLRISPNPVASESISDATSISAQLSSTIVEKAPELFRRSILSANDITFIQELGRGTSGVVYKASHSNGYSLAVKKIILDIDETVQKQIVSELQTLLKCRCEFIVELFGAYFNKDSIFICTEYMDGGSLDNYGVITETILRCLIFRVVCGLLYLWKLKIMHRDIKPSNMLVNSAGYCKLCDFGVSTQLEASIAQSYVGTNVFMAPERIRGEPYRIYSDIWSLGVSIYLLATGNLPFNVTSDSSMSTDSTSRCVNPIHLLNEINKIDMNLSKESTLSFDLFSFISKCLVKTAENRSKSEDLLTQKWFTGIPNNSKQMISRFVLCKSSDDINAS